MKSQEKLENTLTSIKVKTTEWKQNIQYVAKCSAQGRFIPINSIFK